MMRLIGRAAWWGRGCTGCMQCARPGKAAHLCVKRRMKRREDRAWRKDMLDMQRDKRLV